MRSINKIYNAQQVNMGGILLDQALPLRGLDMVDPVLLIHHWKDTLKGNQLQKNVGVGPHPHRGFSPVTFIFKGGVHHRDSMGKDEIVYSGGTQWMNSGSGLVHSERPPQELAEKGGEFEIIQFWINSPAKEKMKDPSYQPLSAEKTPMVKSTDGKIEVGVVNGTFKNVKGPIDASSPLTILRMEGKAGGKMTLPISKTYNCLFYLLDGTAKINGSQLTNKQMAVFNNDDENIDVEFSANSRAIVLAGQPINEKVATYGPFVMNTQTEIMTAMHDYQNGKMGVLHEKFD
jgi:redox-sensitive bicupin YhaK (pirin superfamily)